MHRDSVMHTHRQREEDDIGCVCKNSKNSFWTLLCRRKNTLWPFCLRKFAVTVIAAKTAAGNNNCLVRKVGAVRDQIYFGEHIIETKHPNR